MFRQMISKVDIFKKINLLNDDKNREINYYCRSDTYNYN